MPRWSCPLHGSQLTWSCHAVALWQPPKTALQKCGMQTRGAASSLCPATPDLWPASSGVGMASSTPALGMAVSWSGMPRYVLPGNQCLVILCWGNLAEFNCELQLREHSPWVCSYTWSVQRNSIMNHNSNVYAFCFVSWWARFVQDKSYVSSIHAGIQVWCHSGVWAFIL